MIIIIIMIIIQKLLTNLLYKQTDEINNNSRVEKLFIVEFILYINKYIIYFAHKRAYMLLIFILFYG